MALQLQMTWQPSLLSAKRKTGPPLGLKNLGNTCYLNSVLQCLTYTPPLANFCLRNQHSSLCDSVRDCPFCLLEKRIVRSLRYDGVLDAPFKFQSSLKIFAEHFPGGRQEDAHEFLRYVIDACHNTCLRLKKLKIKGAVEVSNGSSSGGVGGSTTVVKEIFGGALQSQVKCLSCGYESNKVDEIMDISLDVLHSNSLKEAMQKFFQPEVLDGNNKYKCEKCKKLVVARKQMSVLQAPNILVIQLKRFEGIFGGKIDKSVAFEEVLVLSNFMCKESQDLRPEYKLFGTIVHSGYSPESGHYYAYIKDATGSWYCCNDSMVKHTSFQTVLSEKVYILFFTRVNKRSVSVSPFLASKGEKPYTCNGDKFHGFPKDDLAMRKVHSKAIVEKPFLSDISAMPKNGKDPSSPRVKFNFVGNSNSRKGSLIVNGSVDTVKGQSLVKTSSRSSSIMGDKGKDQTSLVKENGFHLNGKAKVDSFGEKQLVMENGNGYAEYNHVNSIKSDMREVSSSTNELMTAGACNHHKLETNGCKSESKSNISRNKRKVEENTSILLAEDNLSRREIEKFKDLLRKEACSVLQSCGWSNEVYKFMWSSKRFCMHEGAKEWNIDDLKKKLIKDAKGTFNSQIPESLKENLIGRLRTFSQGKKQFSGN